MRRALNAPLIPCFSNGTSPAFLLANSSAGGCAFNQKNGFREADPPFFGLIASKGSVPVIHRNTFIKETSQ